MNALEDWRTARIDLLRKFEIQEEQMTEQEERHKRVLYQAEKELIINKARCVIDIDTFARDFLAFFQFEKKLCGANNLKKLYWL